MNKLGALVLTPIAFAAGGMAGQVIGMAFAMPPGDSPAKYRRGHIRPITQRELEWERNGGIIGALVGTTLVALAAVSGEKRPEPGTVGELPPDPRFP